MKNQPFKVGDWVKAKNDIKPAPHRYYPVCTTISRGTYGRVKMRLPDGERVQVDWGFSLSAEKWTDLMIVIP